MLTSSRNTIIADPDTGSIVVGLDENFLDDVRQRAKDFAKFHNKEWQTPYKRGLLNSKERPNEAERFGAMGEQAFHVLTGLDIDRKIRQTGNRHDFSMIRADGNVLRIEVSCKVMPANRVLEASRHATMFYRKARESPEKPLLPLQADLFIFGVIADWSEDHAIVRFDGWATNAIMQEYSKVGSSMRRPSTHENYYIDPKHLYPMLDFAWEYRDGFITSTAELFW